MSLVSKKGFEKKIATLVVTCLMVFLSVLLTACGIGGVSSDKVKDDVLASKIVANGFVSSNFVKETPYELVEFNVTEQVDEEVNMLGIDTAKRVSFTGTIRNESFESTFTGHSYYTDNGNGLELITDPSSDTSTTTPLKGIDFDEQRGVENSSVVFDSETDTCTAIITEEYDIWFVDSVTTSEYSYTFKEKGWEFVEENVDRNLSYKNIDGDYAAKTGNLRDLSVFNVTDLDAEKGTFTINYAYTNITFQSMRDTVTEEITGTLQVVIEPSAMGYNSVADGYSYYFEGGGSSSSGNGQASIKGHFTVSNSGEESIEISAFNVDGNQQHGATSSMITNRVRYLDGVVYK